MMSHSYTMSHSNTPWKKSASNDDEPQQHHDESNIGEAPAIRNEMCKSISICRREAGEGVQRQQVRRQVRVFKGDMGFPPKELMEQRGRT